MQSTLEKRQKKRKLADNAAYRIENKEPVGLPNTKKTESASKKRKLSDDSLEEAQDDNFETMMPGSFTIIVFHSPDPSFRSLDT